MQACPGSIHLDEPSNSCSWRLTLPQKTDASDVSAKLFELHGKSGRRLELQFTGLHRRPCQACRLEAEYRKRASAFWLLVGNDAIERKVAATLLRRELPRDSYGVSFFHSLLTTSKLVLNVGSRCCLHSGTTGHRPPKPDCRD